MFGVTILGNNSALPAYERHPTSQVVTIDQFQFLVDCGEGTQMQFAKYKIRRSRINHIFISHMHGDHYFGLPGFITSLSLLGRNDDLHLYAPPLLKPVLDLMLQGAGTQLAYTLHFHPLVSEGVLAEDAKFIVECFPVFHRIECWGFIFREKKNPRKINKHKIGRYNLSPEALMKLRAGKDIVTKSGEVIHNAELTIPNTPAKSYAYCADTVFNIIIADKVKDVTLLYHETTYLKDLKERACNRFHSTTDQAAQIALKANAESLIIGHFSSKYEVLDAFLEEAREVFPATDLAIEGVTYRL